MSLVELGTDNGFTSGDLETKGYFSVVPAFQKLWICDGRPYNSDIHLSGYHVIDMVNTKITGVLTGTLTVGDTVVQDTSLAAGIYFGAVSATVHLIFRTTTTEFDATNLIKLDAGNYITPSDVKAPPHWLNWVLDTGTFPDGGSNIMCLFEGRLWMNSMFSPNQWFATRQGDPLDLDTGQTDVQAALSSQSSEAGQVADSLVSLIRYKDNYLLFGLANSIYILRGGSTGSGALSSLTDETGIFSPESFCWDNAGNLFLVGMTGFFKVPSGAATEGVALDNISFRKLPNLFKTLKLNKKTDRVAVGFDRDNNTVHVSISMQDGSWAVNFVYDIANDAILPDAYATGCVPASFLYVNDYADGNSDLLLGCYDGYIRKFNPAKKSDDGTAIESYVLFGPITINDLIRANIKIREIQIVLSEDSDGLTWYLYQGKSNEEIVKGIKDGTLTHTHTGTITGGGRQASINEKISGESIAVLFKQNTVDTSWGIEGLKIRYTVAGTEKGA
jgi:hypothetical protein